MNPNLVISTPTKKQKKYIFASDNQNGELFGG
jgi:hypothetical protein